MIKKLVAIAIVAFVILGLLATNPSKTEFINWAKEQLSSSTDSVLNKGLVALVGSAVLDSYTSTQNFLIFSVYTVSYGDTSITVVGILHNFIAINGKF